MRPRDVLKAEGTVFIYTHRPKPVNNIFIYLFIYFFFNEYGKVVCKKFFYALYVALSRLKLTFNGKKHSVRKAQRKRDRLTIKQNFKYLLVQ